MNLDDLIMRLNGLERRLSQEERREYTPTWITYTATVSGATGTIGTYAETVYRQRYCLLGKICHVQVSKKITNVGSWTGSFRVARPVAAVNNLAMLENGSVLAHGGLVTKAIIEGTNDLLFNFDSAWGTAQLAWGAGGVVLNDWVLIDSIYEIA